MVLPQLGKHPVHQLAMFLEVLSEDEDVIQVNNNLPFIDELPEDLVHRPLEGRRRVAETKERVGGLKQAPVGPEGGLPLVSLLDPRIVVSSPNVRLGEVPGTTQLDHQFLDER